VSSNYIWFFDNEGKPYGWQVTSAPVDNKTIFDYPCETVAPVESREEKVRREVGEQLPQILLESASFEEVKQKITDIDISVKAIK